MSQSLPDSGGAYYDLDSGGVMGTLRRNFGEARAALTSGEAGGRAVAVAVGVAAIPAAKYLAEKTGFMS